MKFLALFSLTTFIFCLTARSKAQLQVNIVDESAIASEQEEDHQNRYDERDSYTPDFALSANYYDYLKHNNLLDVRNHDNHGAHHVRGTSDRLLKAIQQNPYRFTEVSNLQFYIEGKELAPLGNIGTKDGKKVFQITDSRSERRKNVIFSAYYENLEEVTPKIYPQATELQSVYEADLILFSHSDRQGAFFSRVKVRLDWNKKDRSWEEFVQVLNAPEFIALANTDFQLEVDLSMQKAILNDSTNNITLLYAITAGAIDNRYDIDGEVNSMTLQVPKNLRFRPENSEELRKEYQDFHMESAALVRKDVWSSTLINTENRTYPSYYMGRPFLAIIDRRYVSPDEDGNVQYYNGYRQIGFHFQIENTLIRGFHSHGCLRTPDSALYTLYAILNHGPKEFIPVEVKNSQPEYDQIDTVVPQVKDSYKQTAYKLKSPQIQVSEAICKPGKSYTVKTYTSRNGQEYETIADGDCLTGMKKLNIPTYDIIQHMKNPSHMPPPTTILAEDYLHEPLQARKDKLIEHYDSLPGRSFTEKDNFVLDYSEEGQLAKISFLANINEGGYNNHALPSIQYFSTNSAIVSGSLNRANVNIFNENQHHYYNHCVNRQITQNQCGRVVNNLLKFYEWMSSGCYSSNSQECRVLNSNRNQLGQFL